jgi:hypothetical protein
MATKTGQRNDDPRIELVERLRRNGTCDIKCDREGQFKNSKKGYDREVQFEEEFQEGGKSP